MAAIGLVIVQIVAVAQVLVLGRLLGPHEVGIFAAGSVLIGVIGGVRPAHPQPCAHPARARHRGCRQHGDDRDLCDGPAARARRSWWPRR